MAGVTPGVTPSTAGTQRIASEGLPPRVTADVIMRVLFMRVGSRLTCCSERTILGVSGRALTATISMTLIVSPRIAVMAMHS